MEAKNYVSLAELIAPFNASLMVSIAAIFISKHVSLKTSTYILTHTQLPVLKPLPCCPVTVTEKKTSLVLIQVPYLRRQEIRQEHPDQHPQRPQVSLPIAPLPRGFYCRNLRMVPSLRWNLQRTSAARKQSELCSLPDPDHRRGSQPSLSTRPAAPSQLLLCLRSQPTFGDSMRCSVVPMFSRTTTRSSVSSVTRTQAAR